MRALEEALLEQEAVLHAAAAATAELDAAMSLASVASDFGFVRPEVQRQVWWRGSLLERSEVVPPWRN